MTDAAAACRVTMDYIKHAPGPAYGTVMCRGAGGCGTGGSSLYKQAALLSMHFKSLFPLNCRIANFGIIWLQSQWSLTKDCLWRIVESVGFEKKETRRVCIYQKRMQHQNGWNTWCCAQVMEEPGRHLHRAQYVKTVHRCLGCLGPHSAPTYFYCQQM